MTHRNRHLAAPQPLHDEVLTILPQLPGIADPEPMLEDLAYFLERQARHFRIEEEDQNPADATDGGVEAKCAGWGHALHHGEEGRRDDDVGTPAGTVMRVSCQCPQEVGEAEVTDQVRNIVPIARTSMGKKSVDIHAVFPTETP